MTKSLLGSIRKLARSKTSKCCSFPHDFSAATCSSYRLTPTYGWCKNRIEKVFAKASGPRAHTQRGGIADFDWQDVGPRFLEPIPDGKYKGFTIAKWLPELVFEYYRLSGRHERTGRPCKETLDQLGLEEFMEWCQLD